MVKCLYVLLGFVAFAVLYSVGAYFVLKSLKVEKPWRALIPFYSFKLINEVAGTFTIFTIPVKNFMMHTLVTMAVCTCMSLYGFWGSENLPEPSVGPLWEIMLLVIILIGVSFYIGVFNLTNKLLLRFQVNRTLPYKVLTLLLVTAPVAYYLLSKKELRIL